MIPGSANPLLLASAAEAEPSQIERSLRFNSSDSAYLSRTPSVAGNRKTWTWAGWVKRSALSTGSRQSLFSSTGATDSDWCEFGFENDSTFYITTLNLTNFSTAVYRDASAWCHVVVAFDTTLVTASDRAIVWINNARMPITVNTFLQNTDYGINRAAAHSIGNSTYESRFFSGYLADIHFIDGRALTPSSFTKVDATTGQLVPIVYTGSYGTNGFHLPFSDNSTAAALGTDTSGNSNTWTVNNISVTAGSGNDSLVDTPTNYGTDTGAGGEVRGNYCTLNPLDKNTNFALSNGNLDGSTGTSIWRGARGTFGVTSGKWYFECIAGSADTMVGIADATTPITDPTFPGHTAYSYGYYGQGGVKYNNNVATAYGSGYTATDVIGVAFDADNGKVFFSKNGVWQASGDPAAGTNAAFTGLTGRVFFPMLATYSTVVANFGQRPFAYTAPSGFKALCTANLDDPLVAQPSTVMDVKLYTGNGSTQTISGLGFSPDLVWTKSRSSGFLGHRLQDIVRGATKELYSNATDAETTNTNSLTSFNSDGFSIGSESGINQSGETFVAWTWDAGDTTDPANEDGSITSSVRANPSAGFSIVSYTGDGAASATIGHGLNVAPQMIIVKNRDVADEGAVYHVGVDATAPEDYFLKLFSTSNGGAARDNTGAMWNDTAPTSSVFSVGTEDNVNASTEDYIAYCFTGVDGYSSFGSYTGNGSTDGPFVYTGFRPSFVLMKRSDSASDWWILDNKRSAAYNAVNGFLYPNGSVGEAIATALDLVSNGFKMRRTDPSDVNASGGTYVWAAFAENPFKTSRAR